jgi:hypothetical protein
VAVTASASPTEDATSAAAPASTWRLHRLPGARRSACLAACSRRRISAWPAASSAQCAAMACSVSPDLLALGLRSRAPRAGALGSRGACRCALRPSSLRPEVLSRSTRGHSSIQAQAPSCPWRAWRCKRARLSDALVAGGAGRRPGSGWPGFSGGSQNSSVASSHGPDAPISRWDQAPDPCMP